MNSCYRYVRTALLKLPLRLSKLCSRISSLIKWLIPELVTKSSNKISLTFFISLSSVGTLTYFHQRCHLRSGAPVLELINSLLLVMLHLDVFHEYVGFHSKEFENSL